MADHWHNISVTSYRMYVWCYENVTELSAIGVKMFSVYLVMSLYVCCVEGNNGNNRDGHQ